MTKAEVITRFTAACSDCDSTLAASLFDEAHQQLCRKFEVYNSELDINLTANERFFNLLAVAKKAINVVYKPSSDESGWTQIMPTTYDELEFYDNFRKNTQTGIPTQYYIGSQINNDGESTNLIGFDKLCPTATSGGYPKVTIYGTYLIPLASNKNLPSALLGYEMVYVYHMAKAYTSLVAPEKMAYWDQLLQQASAALRDDLMSKEYSIEGASLLPAFVTQLNNTAAW